MLLVCTIMSRKLRMRRIFFLDGEMIICLGRDVNLNTLFITIARNHESCGS